MNLINFMEEFPDEASCKAKFKSLLALRMLVPPNQILNCVSLNWF